ncbi:MAG: hypothetical protein WBC14_07265 [Propionicimonas sp.]
MSASPVIRRAERSALRRYSWFSLVAGALAAAALAIGDVWYARIGVVVAIAGGIAGCALAWRALRVQRVAFQAQWALDARANAEKLHGERLQHIRLLQVLQTRNGDLRTRLITARSEAGHLSQELASLRGDTMALRLEVSRLTQAHSAEILSLPRRVSGPVSTHEEILWAEGNLPTVVDLKAVTAPFADMGEQRHA